MGVLAPASSEHRYQTCRDEFCDRYICRIFKEGQRDGFEDGRERGRAEGYAAGYGKGFADGAAEGR